MAKPAKIIAQPRSDDDGRKVSGYLGESALTADYGDLPVNKLKNLVRSAINYANSKSSREILSIPPNATEGEVAEICKREGRKLFESFKASCFDPPLFADKLNRKNYRDVGRKQAREYLLWKCQENDRLRNKILTRNGAWPFLQKMPIEERYCLIYELMVESVPAKRFPKHEEIPDALLESFGSCCRQFGLVDESGCFTDPHRLLQFFCRESSFADNDDVS